MLLANPNPQHPGLPEWDWRQAYAGGQMRQPARGLSGEDVDDLRGCSLWTEAIRVSLHCPFLFILFRGLFNFAPSGPLAHRPFLIVFYCSLLLNAASTSHFSHFSPR